MNNVALLIDIMSIQKYLFSSNKLKENLGASNLVKNIFNDIIERDETLSLLPVRENGKHKGYDGGGNRLFFFENREKAEQFVKIFTRLALVYAPGVNFVSAIEEFNDDFKLSTSRLYEKLRKNKSENNARIQIPRPGFSAEASSDGGSMDVWHNYYDEKGVIDVERSNYVSSQTKAKLKSYQDTISKIQNDFAEYLEEKYCFADELDKLGQSRGSENHIAIVHIDGNAMGERFRNLGSLEETIKLSNEVESAVKESFVLLLKSIVKDLNNNKLTEYLNIKNEKGKKIVPIRPIIMGGDDITFVCDGRMGIYFAKLFMENFEKQEVTGNLPLTSCAGVAIIKTKYPFYKGYQLAEELCANAKKRAKEEAGNSSSWLDFHAAYSGLSGTLSEIRDVHYRAPKGSLLFRPYKINGNDENGIENLINAARKLLEKDKNGKQKYPNNKLKELRSVLSLGEDAIEIFVKEMKARGLVFPEYGSKDYSNSLFIDGKTPYFDLLEVLEFYPKYELEGGII